MPTSKFTAGPRVTNPSPGGTPTDADVSGRWVQLVRPDPKRDAAALWQATHGDDADPGQWTYMSFGPFANSDAMAAWMESVVSGSQMVPLCIKTVPHGDPVGMACYMNIVQDHRTLELGSIWYAPAVRRSPVNTETIYLMLREAFDELQYRRVEWKCDALNQRSRSAATRLGFSYEGLFRQHYVIKGRNRDTAWYAMMDRDWPAIKANFEQVLYGDSRAQSLRELNAPLTVRDPS